MSLLSEAGRLAVAAADAEIEAACAAGALRCAEASQLAGEAGTVETVNLKCCVFRSRQHGSMTDT